MKKIALLTAFGIMMVLSLTAQFPMAGNSKQAPPAMGHIYGKIIDSTGATVTGASVILLQNRFDTATKKRKDVLLNGITTKSNGEFSFTDLPIFGQLKLKISATGYKAYEQTVSFQMKMDAGAAPKQTGADPAQAMAAMSKMINAFDKDLGNIKLEVDTKQLGNVTVVSKTPT
ncbi:MAG: carboxypeptidase-like regulatory domain-containing protein [Bacteroidota bacterium]